MFSQLLELNKHLFSLLNQLGDIEIVRNAVYIFVDAPIFLIPIFLVGFWLYYASKKNAAGKERLLLVFYSIVLAVLINIVVQKLLYVERPTEFAKSAGHFILSHVPDASFPSDHASMGAAFITALFFFGYEVIGYAMIPFFFLMLISRIIWGVHWPFDILGGAIVGVFSALTIASLQKNVYMKRCNNWTIGIAGYLKL